MLVTGKVALGPWINYLCYEQTLPFSSHKLVFLMKIEKLVDRRQGSTRPGIHKSISLCFERAGF